MEDSSIMVPPSSDQVNEDNSEIQPPSPYEIGGEWIGKAAVLSGVYSFLNVLPQSIILLTFTVAQERAIYERSRNREQPFDLLGLPLEV